MRDELTDSDREEYELEEDGYPCPTCGGTGLSVEGWDCEDCDGEGYWEV